MESLSPPAGTRRGAWARRLSFAAGCLLVVNGGIWVASPASWLIDVLANLGAHTSIIALIAAVWWGVRRRWPLFFLAAIAIGLHAAVIIPGRAPWATGPPSVRVMTFNPNHDNTTRPEAIESICASEADIVAMVEAPLGMVLATREGGALRTAYPYVVHRGSGPGRDTSHHALLSRWPLSRIDGVPVAEGFDGVIEVVVESPGGPFGVVVAHPHSPRTASRWRRSLDEVARVVDAARRLTDHGLPVVVLGDLNSTPTGLVSRRIGAGASLRRCKPLSRCDGTFPAQRTWPARVAIDDAFVSEGVWVTDWVVLEPLGSDHTPVLIGLKLP